LQSQVMLIQSYNGQTIAETARNQSITVFNSYRQLMVRHLIRVFLS